MTDLTTQPPIDNSQPTPPAPTCACAGSILGFIAAVCAVTNRLTNEHDAEIPVTT